MTAKSEDVWQEASEQLISARDVIRFGATQMAQSDIYFGHGTDNAWDEAIFLLLEVLQLPWSLLDSIIDARLTQSERDQVLNLYLRRIHERKPAPYLVGRAWFAELPFLVNEHVLVPRSPFAELIEKQFSPWLTKNPERILDLCTGSGCIGIATALAFPESTVDLSDISAHAVDTAWQNIDYHQVDDRVRAVESDLFSALDDQRYDLIITNPPYVDKEDLDSMPKEYHHEPEIALASGEDGLNFTRRLLTEAKKHLAEDGLLFCEVGNSWWALDEAFPDLNLTWIEFENGGHGVFVIDAKTLAQHF